MMLSKKICAVILILVMAAGSFYGLTYINHQKEVHKYESMSEKEILGSLEGKNIDEIVKEIDYMSGLGFDISSFIYHSNALSDLADKLTTDDIMGYITDDDYSLNTRMIMSLLYNERRSEGGNDNNGYISKGDLEEYASMIINKETDGTTASDLLLNLDGCGENVKNLVDTVLKNKDETASAALNRLYSFEPETASELAKYIIENDEPGTTERFRDAIIIRGLEFKNVSDDNESKIEFVEYCEKLLEEISVSEKDSDYKLESTLIEALKYSENKEALVWMLKNDNIEEYVKTGLIYYSMENMVPEIKKKSDLSEEYIKAVLDMQLNTEIQPSREIKYAEGIDYSDGVFNADELYHALSISPDEGIPSLAEVNMAILVLNNGYESPALEDTVKRIIEEQGYKQEQLLKIEF